MISGRSAASGPTPCPSLIARSDRTGGHRRRVSGGAWTCRLATTLSPRCTTSSRSVMRWGTCHLYEFASATSVYGDPRSRRRRALEDRKVHQAKGIRLRPLIDAARPVPLRLRLRRRLAASQHAVEDVRARRPRHRRTRASSTAPASGAAGGCAADPTASEDVPRWRCIADRRALGPAARDGCVPMVGSTVRPSTDIDEHRIRRSSPDRRMPSRAQLVRSRSVRWRRRIALRRRSESTEARPDHPM